MCCRAQAKRPPLCTILSMSQRLRSLKITRRDRRGLRVIFFHSPLFVIRCQQNFLGAQTTAFMSWVSHGLTACRAAHSNTRAKRLRSTSTQCLFGVWSHKHQSIFIRAERHSLGNRPFSLFLSRIKSEKSKVQKSVFSHLFHKTLRACNNHSCSRLESS